MRTTGAAGSALSESRTRPTHSTPPIREYFPVSVDKKLLLFLLFVAGIARSTGTFQ
ncbi:hypothetical protein D3C71_1969930 [compost metagenome]